MESQNFAVQIVERRNRLVKNIIVIVGSPRKNGNTEILADAFIGGARSAGNHVEKISVIGKTIGCCIGCNACYWDAEHLSSMTIWRTVTGIFRRLMPL
jgi:multimeric flavodoxin WrbA